MTKNNGHSEAKPEFDFSHISRRWTKQWLHTMTTVSEAQLELTEIEQADDPAVQKQQARRQLELVQSIERLMGDQESMIAQVLKTVPREWLPDDAPDDLDWSNPESLEWVLESRYAELVDAMQAARQADPKGSRGTTR
ncbi:MAG: hypothetical protein K8L99_18175 [Anaerolineae bacterium]|nr:hypothetical protein [Anaerolineae bacterium]